MLSRQSAKARPVDAPLTTSWKKQATLPWSWCTHLLCNHRPISATAKNSKQMAVQWVHSIMTLTPTHGVLLVTHGTPTAATWSVVIRNWLGSLLSRDMSQPGTVLDPAPLLSLTLQPGAVDLKCAARQKAAKALSFALNISRARLSAPLVQLCRYVQVLILKCGCGSAPQHLHWNWCGT